MPLKDQISAPLTPAEMTALNTALDNAVTTLTPKAVNLTAEERQKYGSIGEQNKLIVQKVELLASTHPSFKSPQVNWTEFASDNQMRRNWEMLQSKLDVLTNIVQNSKILYDKDCYDAALVQYNYLKYLADTQSPGADQLYRELQQFFNRTGTTTASASSATDTTPTT
jgi:tRNA U34 5-carboxymethylaminomethyl modifying enzyme MnmG/GidA